ncbi:MAG: tetratricopeptide repeat protein [Coriobacteriaceae bacterium]|jgi:tetratricopeptide (TPR) repeat protein|nr:tetratricopeptide repeat protein [Coriobacteriaceae bacterium]
MDTADIIARSCFALLGQEAEAALALARKAVALDPQEPEAHKAAAEACMSLGRYDEAVSSYRRAAECDPGNGDRHFELGYALTAADDLAAALGSLAKAEELGCTPAKTAQLYDLLGVICYDVGRYNDAIANFERAERLVGFDPEILQRKAVIYGIKGDLRNGLAMANRLKMLALTEYRGYQIAFNLLLQAGRLDDAGKELERAGRYAAPTMDLCYDSVTLMSERFKADGDKAHLEAALAAIEGALGTIGQTPESVAECYLRAAEVHLKLEDPDAALRCIDASQSPAWSYNRGFRVIARSEEPIILTEYDVEDMIAADCERIAEELGEHGLEELVEGTEQNEDGSRDYLTDIDSLPQQEEDPHILDEQAVIPCTPKAMDRLNRLYLGAYSLKDDFGQVIDFARRLQGSEDIQCSYLGRYAEAKALADLGSPEAFKKYEEVERFFRHAMVRDSTDILAVSYRIQCNIDQGNLDEAEDICRILAKPTREPLLKRIAELRESTSVREG